MREILFRGKRADNGEWVEGGILQTENWVSIFVCKDYQGSMNEPPCCDVEEYEVIPETVGQYTGLTDKNGKKIYEGDIIQSLETKETAVVQWFPEHFAFMVWCKSSNEVGFLYECTKSNIEVIGNIYDNPELLEQEG